LCALRQRNNLMPNLDDLTLSMKLDETLTLGNAVLDLHIVLVIGILLAAGLLAGLASYYMQRRATGSGNVSALLSIIWGWVAALTIPLFLSTISSDLIELGRLRPEKLLVLAGFSFIYVLLSHFIFEAAVLSLKREDSSKSEGGRNIPDPLRSYTVTTVGLTKSLEPSRTALLYGDFQLMEAIAKLEVDYGNMDELIRHCSLDRDQIIGRLAVLKAARLIETRMNEKSELYWKITAKGRHLLDEVAVGEQRRDGNSA
jgi:DNA-binding MarR family transcriptional regulator